MFSKKPKQEPADAPKRKGAELMNQMGFGMPTNMEDMEAMVYGDDDDDDLEAELAALTGDDLSSVSSRAQKQPAVRAGIEVFMVMVYIDYDNLEAELVALTGDDLSSVSSKAQKQPAVRAGIEVFVVINYDNLEAELAALTGDDLSSVSSKAQKQPAVRAGIEVFVVINYDNLEAELAALTGDDLSSVSSKAQKLPAASSQSSPARVSAPRSSKTTRAGPVDLSAIEKMGTHDFDDVSDVSDTEDPDLLSELAELEDDDPQQLDPVSPPSQPPPSQRSPAPAPSPSSQRSPPSLSPSTPQASPSLSPSQGSGGGNVVTVVQDRIGMYQQAMQAARQIGDTSKQRRLDRGLKTLTDTLRKAKAGKPIGEEDLPPPVAMGTSTNPNTAASSTATPSVSQIPSTSAEQRSMSPPSLPPPQASPSLSPSRPPPQAGPSVPVVQPGPSQLGPSTSSSTDVGTRQTLLTRKEQYRHAALAAKRGGDMPTAAKYAKIAKQFDSVLHALDDGKPIDLTRMPPPLPAVAALAAPEVRVQRSAIQGTGEKGAQAEEPSELPPEPTEEESKKLFHAPDAPRTVMEALVQRMEKYKSSESSAKQAGEGGKARRMGRIVKQYESAVKDHKAGKPVDFEELPTPPGFGPIPVNAGPPPPRASPSPQQQAPPAAAPAAAVVARATVSPPQPAPRPQAPAAVPRQAAAAGASAGAVSRGASSRKSGHSRLDQQLGFLRERMEEFKTAALQAKKNKDLEMAKQHIRMMKGLEPMIEALESGLPVDLSQVPPSPLANEENEDKYVIVNAEDCTPTGDRDTVFPQLEQDLVNQIRICATNAQHFTKLGDVPAASKFQKMEQGCRKDLDSVKSARRHGDPIPKFHYETRSFSVVQCNTELGDAEMEVTIVRGISYNLPSGYAEKDMDTMVKYELAFPTDEVQDGHTSTVKNTINPEYDETFKLNIDRKSRSFARVVERKGIKMDIFIKRGFFKGDKLLGSATVKLTALESKCTLHDSFDLMDGRKSVGGKLEVKVRVRDPFKGRQVEESKEKWLVIDQFIRTVGSKSLAGQASGGQKPKKQPMSTGVYRKLKPEGNSAQAKKTDSDGTNCMEVLRFEKQQLDKQISYLKDGLSAIQMQTLRHKSALLEEKLELQQKQLREGGLDGWKAYMVVVEKEVVAFEGEARQLTRIGDVQKAETMMHKVKLGRKELAAIKAKIPG